MQGAWRFQERRLRKSAAIVLATAIAPVAAAEAQGIAIERIEAIERQIGGLQSELRRLKSELGEAKQQLRQSRSEAQSAQEELKRSRDQLRASQEGTLRAREAAQRVQEQTKTAQQPPPVAPSPAAIITTSDGSIQVGGVKLQPGAGSFVEAAGIFRTRNEVSDIGTDYQGIPFKNSVLAHEHEFRGSARQSRLSLLISGDVSEDTHLAAYVESDFLAAGTTSNSRESNSYVPRLRQGYGTVVFDRIGFHILAGQAWSLLTTNTNGIVPRSEQIPPTIEHQFVPGFNWTRSPQARFVEKFSDAVSAGVSFETPQALFPLAPFAAPTGVNVSNPGDSAGFLNATTTYSNDLIPDTIGKFAFDPGWGHYELKGLARLFTDRANGRTHETWGYGVGGAATLPIVPKYLDLQISGLVGDGIGRYGTTLFPDVALSANNSLVAIPAAQGLLGLVGHPWPGTDVYVYGGWEHAERAGARSVAGYGSPTLINTGCNIEGSTVCAAETKDIRQLTGGIWQDLFNGPYGRGAAGLQGSYTVRQAFNGIGGAPNTNQGIVFVSFRYFPFWFQIEEKARRREP
jgi:hypothetical protein